MKKNTTVAPHEVHFILFLPLLNLLQIVFQHGLESAGGLWTYPCACGRRDVDRIT